MVYCVYLKVTYFHRYICLRFHCLAHFAGIKFCSSCEINVIHNVSIYSQVACGFNEIHRIFQLSASTNILRFYSHSQK